MDVAMFLAGFLVSGLRSCTPLFYVLLGETLTERVGVVNLGVEGQMLIGAFFGFAVTVWTGNPWLGMSAGAGAGMALSAVHGILCVALKANFFASGVALWMLGGGLSAYFGINLVGQKINGFPSIPWGPFAHIPVLGQALAQLTPTVLLSLFIGPAVGFWLFRTRPGLRWRAVGESAESARTMGIVPERIKWQGILAGGFLSGFGGASLSVDYTRNWIEWMTAGRGLIAVGLVIVARWNPYLALPAAFLFGATEALTLRLQSMGVKLSPYLLSTLPYLVCLAVLVYGYWRARQRGGMPRDLAAAFAHTE
jgi:general nucleoside transport system permease protein